MINAMKADKEIWYLDETSTHLWQKKDRMWRPADGSLCLSLLQKRGSSITIIGAISNKRPKLFFELYDSTNTVNVENFMKEQFWNMNVSGHLIVMDQNSMHEAVS